MDLQNPQTHNTIRHAPEVIRQHTNAFAEEIVPRTPESEKVIEVEVVSSHVRLDGESFKQGDVVKISVKQWRALSLHFKWKSGPEEHCPAYALPTE